MRTSPTRLLGPLRASFGALWTDGRGWILTAVSVGWFLSIGVRYIYPSVLPFMRATFEMDLTLAGSLLSTLWVAYALGQFPGGVLGDRVGEGNILVASTVVSTIAVTLVAVSVNVAMLFLATAAFGFATGLFGPHRFTIFTDIYPERSGTAVGVTMAVGSVGNTLLPALAVAVAGYAGWQLGYGMLVPVFALTCLAIYRVVPARTSTSTADTETFSWATLRRVAGVVRARGIPPVVGIHVVISFVSSGFLGFYPTYLIEVKGFAPQTAALLFGSYFAIGTVVQPLTGIARDRAGSRRTLALITAVVFAGLVGVLLVESLLAILLLTALISLRNGVGVVTNTFIADAMDDDIKGSGLGLLRTSWLFAAALSPTLVGVLGDLGQLRFAYLVLASISGVALLLTVLVPADR